jgi:hypothetical protein
MTISSFTLHVILKIRRDTRNLHNFYSQKIMRFIQKKNHIKKSRAFVQILMSCTGVDRLNQRSKTLNFCISQDFYMKNLMKIIN